MNRTQDKEYFEKALNTYYKMKSKYEEEIRNKIETIRNRENLDQGIVFRQLNLKKAQKEVKDFKAKCQNCKRPVGMIFTTSYSIQNVTPVFKCVCGDTREPCNLNITLETGYTELLQDSIQTEKKEVDKNKQKIIIDKNKLLFGFLSADQVIRNYEEYKEEMNTSFELIEANFEQYMEVVNNLEKEKKIKVLQVEYNNYVQELRENMKKFDMSRDKQYLDRAVELHNMIVNKENELEEMKYRDMRIEKDDNTNTFHLIQKKVVIPDLETELVKPKVVSFITNANSNTNTNTNGNTISSRNSSSSSSFTNISSIFSNNKDTNNTQETEEKEETEETPEEQLEEQEQLDKKEPVEEEKPSNIITDTIQDGFELIEDSVMSLFQNQK